MSHILYHSSPASPARFAFAIDPDAEDEDALGVWFFPTWEAALTAAGNNGVVNAARVETDGPAKALSMGGFEDMQKKAFSYTEGAGVYGDYVSTAHAVAFLFRSRSDLPLRSSECRFQ
jgi:hypothetical protein